MNDVATVAPRPADAERAAPPKPRPLPTIAADLEKATTALKSAQDKARQASRAETDAINKVNELQREFDEAIKRLKGAAPSQTDWDQQNNPPRRSAVQPQGPGNAG